MSQGRNLRNWRNIGDPHGSASQETPHGRLAGDPHGRLAGDPHGPIFSMETRIFLLQTPIPYFRWRPPDFH